VKLYGLKELIELKIVADCMTKADMQKAVNLPPVDFQVNIFCK
jgi:hypothetical protein